MAFPIVPITSQAHWEDFILRHCPAALFQSWPWGQVQEALGVKIWRLGIREDQKLIGLAQVVKTQAKRGWFLHVRHGPVFIGERASFWKVILDYLVDLARQERCWFIRASPLVPASQKLLQLCQPFRLQPAPIHAMDAELCWVLDLNKTEDELLSGMRKTTRYEIKQAKKLGIKVIKSQNINDLHVFLKLYQETTARHGFVPHPGIAEEFKVFASKNKAVLFLGKSNGAVIAGAMVLFYGHQAIYHHGASVWSKLPVSSWVQWQGILEAKKRGYKLYNFWGIAPKDKTRHPWRGITLFKKGFGGREVSYIHAHDLPVSPLYAIPRAIESIRRIIKGY